MKAYKIEIKTPAMHRYLLVYSNDISEQVNPILENLFEMIDSFLDSTLKISQVPELDDIYDKKRTFDCIEEETQKMFWNAKVHYNDEINNADSLRCDKCSRFEFLAIPKSRTNWRGTEFLCESCKNDPQSRKGFLNAVYKRKHVQEL
uniref:Uncharacterized protein n=1 Tax=viral metagenome TaxID=1070528 RepID=A0A6H1ZN75_9ZZZZ